MPSASIYKVTWGIYNYIFLKNFKNDTFLHDIVVDYDRLNVHLDQA
jgi:hypothetical protein